MGKGGGEERRGQEQHSSGGGGSDNPFFFWKFVDHGRSPDNNTLRSGGSVVVAKPPTRLPGCNSIKYVFWELLIKGIGEINW